MRANAHTRALVTGATGAVGPALVEWLGCQGQSVRVLARHPVPAGFFACPVEVVTGDVTDPDALARAVVGVDTVFHFAALLHVADPPPELRAEYIRVNLGGTQAIAEASQRAGVRRIVFASTIAVYGYRSSERVTEDTPPHPQTAYAESKLAAERILLEANRHEGVPLATVLRLAAVYGPRVKGNYRRLLQALARGRFIPVGEGRNRRALVYDRDAARAAATAAWNPAAAGRVYNVSDGEPHTLQEIIATICAVLGRTPPRFSVPLGPARMAAGLCEDLARMVGLRSPVGRAAIDKYTEDVAVDSQRIQTELGFVPQFDLATGWRETVREMRRVGCSI